MVEVPEPPTLATIPSVEIASVGFWNISNAMDWHPSADDLAAAVAALDCPAVRRPVLKFGHTGEPGEGDPSIGLIDALRLSDDGQTLLGDYVGVPSWLASADSEGRSVIASAYPDRSGEFQRDYVCQLGHTHPFVVHAVALLGVMRPGIGTLESLYDLYTKAPEKETAMAGIAQAGTSTDDIRREYYAGPGKHWSLWIREVFVEPAELIVQNDEDDSLLRVPYIVSTDGSVEFGDGQTVKVEYVNARAATDKPAVAFASRAEARTAHTDPSAAQAEVNQGKEHIVPTLKEGLAQKLGIAADADDETTLQALDEALAERADVTNISVTNTPEAPTVEQIAARAKELGLVMVESDQYEATVAQARQGAEARAQQLRESDERIVDAAIGAGKVAPARREHHLAAMAADREGHQAVLDSLAPGLIPLAEAGHSKQPADGPVPNDLGWFDSAPTAPSSEGKE
ncbi:phage protease [Mycobacteroides abscessus]|uniref:phage protease n=1 Tax=Mycobacteroides abscessus TaxID=36809 RepID=UPI000AA968CD|nr:phage protease [Mycobacteroides abscessus]